MNGQQIILTALQKSSTRGSKPSHVKKLGGNLIMNVRLIAKSALIAALSVAITIATASFSFSNIQFRVAEMLNHLVVFNKKYVYGIVAGVFFANLLLSTLGPIDLVFGVGQSIIALSITIFSGKFIKNITKRMIFNTVVFTLTMVLIAWELNIVLGLPFLLTWLTVALGEIVVMSIGIPIFIALNKRLQFEKLI